MSKWIIFDNESGNVQRFADTDDKKNNFLSGQSIYTAKSVNDTDFNNVRHGYKNASLSNDTINYEDITNNYENNLQNAKNIIKSFIEAEKNSYKMMTAIKSNQEIENIINSLNALDVEAVNAIPTVPLRKWLIDQGIVDKNPLDL